MAYYSVLKIILIILSLIATITESYKICSSPSNSAACQQLGRDLKLACRSNLHNVDCLLNINNNLTHIGRISAEEAALGANLLSENVVVLGEITSRFAPPETVVIVKTSIPNDFVNLRGKKLCHPGFKHDSLFSSLFLQELELKVIEADDRFCNRRETTLLEKQISSLSEFFGESCRPGPWTQDDNFDVILKSKYSSLCNLCGSQRCQIDYEAPFNDSLRCLTDNDADIAVTTLYEAQQFFNSSYRNMEKYKYLCKNGTSTSASVPCVWSSQLNSLLVAERSAADEIKYYLENKMSSKITGISPALSDDIIEDALVIILGIQRFEKVKLFSEYQYASLKRYVAERRPVPTLESSKRCGLSLKWCTYSDAEQEKCRWLSQAALNRAIQPVVECARSEFDDELECLNDIKKGSADIVVASADYAYITLKKNLSSLAYPETDTRNLSTILAVKRQNDRTINSFKDLRGRGACLPQYGGKELLTFIDNLRKLEVIEESYECNYGKLLSDFVGNSCVPGVRNKIIDESTDDVDKDKLCSNCVSVNVTRVHSYCNADSVNKYYGNEGAIRCLNAKSGDFAIITKPSVLDDETNNLTVICKNGSLATTSGLTVDQHCALNTITTSEVVSKGDNPKNSDIKLALYEFERWFGQELRKPFHLFDAFNGTLDLLFKDSTPGLNFEVNNEYIQNYYKMLEYSKTCKSGNSDSGSGSSKLMNTFVLSFVSVCALYLYQ